jgi:dolichyl-phosphate-mannose--protein O-mannosyl transferase
MSAWRQAWARLSRGERATTVAIAVMIAGGVVLRIQGIGFPPRFTFDEQHFVPNARNYLLGLADDNDHPPLGKLFIAIGLLLFGDGPVGWRAASLILGLQSLVIAYWLARELFDDARAGWFAAAFLAADGFFISYSRTALLDGGLTCLVLFSLLAAVTARTWRGVLVCAVLVGLSASIKWSGGLVVVPAVLAVLFRRRARPWSILLFAVAPLVHLGLWLGAFALTERPVSLRGLWTLMVDLFHRHHGMANATNPLASPWYSWPVLYHPIVVKLADHGLKKTYASSAGNPLLFFATTASVAGACAVGLWRAIRSPWRRLRDLEGSATPPTPTHEHTRAVALLAAAWLALLAPWTVGRGGYVFMYHYLPSYAFGLVLLAGLMARLERRHPWMVVGFVGLALGFAIFFAPVWGEFPITESAAIHRLVFIPWRP